MLTGISRFGWIFKTPVGWKGHQRHIGGWNPAWPRRVGDALGESPHASEESDFMPLGRHHISVYERVIVGSDGTETSLYAVNRAHAVPAEADSHVLVVSAYNPGPAPSDLVRVDARRELYGKETALHALRLAVKYLTSDRVRSVDTKMVAGDPAQALLDAAGSDPQSLIVVGNRGLGAIEGHELGSVPSEVVHQA